LLDIVCSSVGEDILEAASARDEMRHTTACRTAGEKARTHPSCLVTFDRDPPRRAGAV
jgi:hypothetical protein